MKKTQLFFGGFFLLFLFTNSLCRKGDAEPQLPPETTIGAGTFGCKVNGKVFIPKSGWGQPGLYAAYINEGNGPGGGWYLNIVAIYSRSSNSVGVTIQTDSLLLLEGQSYLFKVKKGYPGIFYNIGLDIYPFNESYPGELFITKHDLNQRILSGRFSFTGMNASGQKVEITEGRFDIFY